MNLLLIDRWPPATLSYTVDICQRWREKKDFWINEIVMEYDVSFAEKPPSFQREQFRIAGTRSHQVDFAFHLSIWRTFRRRGEFAFCTAESA